MKYAKKARCEWCGADPENFYEVIDQEDGLEKVKCGVCEATIVVMYSPFPPEVDFFAGIDEFRSGDKPDYDTRY